MSTATRVAGGCGADGRLDEALAWCRWFERTGAWPVTGAMLHGARYPEPRRQIPCAQVPGVGVMQGTVEPPSARMSPAVISRAVSEPE